jgi:hypothetical protein
VPSNHSQITGKPYEFGDLSRKIDESIKDKVNDLTGNDDYAFGDLSKWVDTQIKGEVNKFTKKESYQFGDMSREIVRRVASGQYTLDDLFLLLKALAIFEASISPVGEFALGVVCLECCLLDGFVWWYLTHKYFNATQLDSFQ